MQALWGPTIWCTSAAFEFSDITCLYVDFPPAGAIPFSPSFLGLSFQFPFFAFILSAISMLETPTQRYLQR